MLLLTVAGLLALAAASVSAGVVPTATTAPTATNPIDPTPTTDVGETRPTATATSEGSGGIVVSTPTPTEEQGGIAPGFVTVVVWTSDGAPLPGDTIVCVGAICQSGGGLGNGAKIEFDRVDSGWHDVTAQGVAPYTEAASSVQVVQGQGSRVELTIVLGRPQVEVTPTERASGPIRQPVVDVGTADGAQTWNAQDPAPTNVVVQSLPVTGAGDGAAATQNILLALGATLLLGAAGVAVHRGRRA
jgi:hypothetical protein